VWELYPEVREVLKTLQPRFTLAVISNFDGRLRMILEQFGIAKVFRWIFISSEMGAEKPDPLIYRRALQFSATTPNEGLHVGDDRERDWNGAAAAGLQVFQLDRQRNSLRDLLAFLNV
jgi:putative hydrolase of the HAD superfamily